MKEIILTPNEISLVQFEFKKLIDSRRNQGFRPFGKSNYHSTKERKNEKDQQHYLDGISGQAANYAVIKYLFSPGVAVLMYLDTRNKANSKPGKGDKGSDIDGYKVDIKSNKLMCPRHLENCQKWSLAVFPRERHPGICYIRTFVYFESYHWKNSSSRLEDDLVLESLKVYIQGYLPESEISRELEEIKFGNSRRRTHLIYPHQLNPMSNFYLEDWAIIPQLCDPTQNGISTRLPMSKEFLDNLEKSQEKQKAIALFKKYLDSHPLLFSELIQRGGSEKLKKTSLTVTNQRYASLQGGFESKYINSLYYAMLEKLKEQK